MTEGELQTKLQELLQLPHETEWVEFKEATNTFEVERLGEYFSALSNEANLKCQKHAWLVFGIQDKSKKIVGSQFRPDPAKLDALKHEIANHTTGQLTFDGIYALQTQNKRVILFQIPPALSGVPTGWKGHFYGRDGESTVALSLHEIEQIRNQHRVFESEIATSGLSQNDVLNLLDFEAYYRLTLGTRPTEQPSQIVTRLIAEKLVFKQENTFQITNLGAILFARDLNQFLKLGKKAVRIIKYKGTSRVQTEREWQDPLANSGYAAVFEAAISYVNSQLPQNELIRQALRKNERVYPEIAIRELVANTLIHQDFWASGVSPKIELFEDRIEFTNPGEPLVAPERFIDLPPRSRNEELAGMVRRLNICEERGSGIDKVITQIEAFQLPPPDFRVVPGSTIVLLFAPQTFSKMNKEERSRACYQHCVLCWISNTLMTNASLRKRFGISAENYPMVSKIIKDALDRNLIKKASDSPKEYLPHWA